MPLRLERAVPATSKPVILGQVLTRITFLELTRPPEGAAPLPPHPACHVIRACRPTVSFYRYLYTGVGEAWLWTNRRLTDDITLHRIISNPAVEIQVLWHDGVPAGFAEIDRSRDGVVDLAYFGLFPEFIGYGLGRWFLDTVIRIAFATGPARLTVNTCDLDHPHALVNYQGRGFRVIEEKLGYVRLLEGMALPRHRQDAQIVRGGIG